MLDFSTRNFNFPCVLTFQVIGNTGTNGWRNTSTPRITILTSCPFWSQTWIMCEQTTSFMLCPNRERFGTILSCFYLFIFPLYTGGFNLNNCFDYRSLCNKRCNNKLRVFREQEKSFSLSGYPKITVRAKKLFARAGTLAYAGHDRQQLD